MCFNLARSKRSTSAAIVAVFLGAALFVRAQVADCIAATVNGRIITSVDVIIVEAFGILEPAQASDRTESRRSLLDKMIDQKIVLDVARDPSPVDRARIDAELRRISAGMGEAEFGKRLEEFGIELSDLGPYLEEKIRCEALLESRFGRSASVTLREIEAYYAEIYVPAENKLGREPRPMMDVLNMIESEIKKAKAESQFALWVKNLREQAEIVIRADCLKN
jgi:hypothetical protein